MRKDENKRAINFLLDKNKAKLLSAFALKEDDTLAGLLEKMIDKFILENKEQAEFLIKAYGLEMNI